MKMVIPMFLAVIVLAGCDKEVTPVPDTYYFKGDVDLQPVHWDVTEVASRMDTSKFIASAHYFYSQWPVDCTTVDCYDAAAGTIVGERNRGNGIQVVYVQAKKTPDLNDLKTLFTPGLKPYGKKRTSPYTNTENGILVQWDEGGRVWRSELGEQSGSSFEVVEFRESSSDKDLYSGRWKARFTCKVYFDGLPPKTLQNCEVYGPAFFK